MSDPSGTSNNCQSASRRKTRAVSVGRVIVGGGSPVVIQSMTNTDTVDVVKTAIQCAELARAGSELVRITVNTPEAAAAVPKIRTHLDSMGVDVPLIGDFHYNGHRLLSDYPECAQVLDKYRINPGNVGHGKKRDEQFAQMIEIAARYNKPVRIGVNWGSLDQDLLARIMDENGRRAMPMDAVGVMREAMVASALESAAKAEELGLPGDRIILSCKVSGVQDLIAIYRELSLRSDYPLHLGLTEAGMGSKGIVASTAAMAVLLQEGIGDTIRVSLTPEPGGKRTQEVVVARFAGFGQREEVAQHAFAAQQGGGHGVGHGQQLEGRFHGNGQHHIEQREDANHEGLVGFFRGHAFQRQQFHQPAAHHGGLAHGRGGGTRTRCREQQGRPAEQLFQAQQHHGLAEGGDLPVQPKPGRVDEAHEVERQTGILLQHLFNIVGTGLLAHQVDEVDDAGLRG